MARGCVAGAATFEPGAFTSPKVMAPVGQASMQAGTTAPSGKVTLSFPSRGARAFGSRVTGTAKPYSDLDLAIVGPERLELGRLGAVRGAPGQARLADGVDRDVEAD